MDMDGREFGEDLLYEPPGFEAEVIRGVAGDGETIGMEGGFSAARGE
jgi:hypothetical protein